MKLSLFSKIPNIRHSKTNPVNKNTVSQNSFSRTNDNVDVFIKTKEKDSVPLTDTKNNLLIHIKSKLDDVFSNPEMKTACISYLTPDEYIEGIKKGKFDIAKYINAGGESLIFELKDGDILKLSPRKHNFSIKGLNPPEISRGVITLENNEKIYYISQKKVNVGGITEAEFEELKKKAEAEDCILDDAIVDGSNTIKQSNFGWYSDENNSRNVCIIDSGVLKRKSERHIYEELINLEGKKNIKEKDFTNHINTVLLNLIRQSNLGPLDIDGHLDLMHKIIDDFIEATNNSTATHLEVFQETLKKNGVKQLKEY